MPTLLLMHELLSYMYPDSIEAGCDEAGRGCLAGPVVAAAVILPKDFYHPLLNDSKLMTLSNRTTLRTIIEKESIAYAVSFVNEKRIDEINILNASFEAMHRAVDQLSVIPNLILVDGNRFNPYKNIRHECVIKGDGKYLSMAAASVLAKTYRDDYMQKIHHEFPIYDWHNNKGYPTRKHRIGIKERGDCIYHRKSFTLLPPE